VSGAVHLPFAYDTLFGKGLSPQVASALSVLHLANGLWSMGIVWGVTTTARAQRLSAHVSFVLGAVLAAMGVHGLLGFLP